MGYPIAQLQDDFVNNVQDAVWSASAVSGSATKDETSGEVRLTLPSSTAGTHVAYYRTSVAYDLTAGSFYWNIDTMVATGVAATAILDLRSADSQNALRWTQTSGTLKAQTVLAGVATDQYSVAWNASTYKYLRVRESGGNVLFDSSTNGTSWTNRASVAAPFAVTDLFVVFAATCGNVASPGSLRIEDVNLVLPAPSSTWRETTADWQITNRLRSVTLASDGGKQGVLVTAGTMDSSRVLGGTLRYFAGPLGSTSGGYLELTEYASLALAQASAFPLPVDGRVDLPALVDARFMRLYHRSIDASSHTIYEYMPRRLVQADDIEAESIVALNISAGAITADKIFVINLQAVSALMGSLTMDGPIDITTGSIIGGGGVVTLSSDGLLLETGSSYADLQSYQLIKSDATPFGGMGGTYNTGTQHTVEVRSKSITSEASNLRLFAQAPSADLATVFISIQSGLTNFTAISCSTDDTTHAIVIDAQNTSGTIELTSPTTIERLHVGTATGAAAGEIMASGEINAHITNGDTTARAYPLILNHSSSGTPSTLFGTGIQMLAESSTTADQPVGYMEARWTVATHASRRSEITFLVFDASSFRVPLTMGTTGSASAVGFHGSTPIAKPTVTGSRGGNAALASLLTQLASYGLITDSSS